MVLQRRVAAARAGTQAYKEVDRLQKEAASGQLQDHNDDPKQQDTDGAKNSKKSPVMDEEHMKKAADKIEASLPALLELAWAINVQDISRTLKNVCHKLFHDAAELLTIEQRLDRAHAVLILGREFHSMGKLAKKTSLNETTAGETAANCTAQEIRRRAEVAAMTTLAKAQGQEISDQDAEEMIRQSKAMEQAHP